MRPAAAMLALLPVFPAAAQESPRIVGGPGAGCIAGAVELPPLGPGYQTIRQSRSAFWGYPGTVAALELLARRAQAIGLGTLYMNDISLPRGGPMAGLHASHMLGLDADVWLDVRHKPPLTPAQRDAVEVQSLVTPDGNGVDAALWNPGVGRLIRLAAGLPGVDRILVNPAIKRQLCLEAAGDRAWLHRVRPWYGHAAHMHIHFRCPPDQKECRDQRPIPPGDGCDASLDWWFAQLGRPLPPAAPPRPPRLPAACAAILDPASAAIGSGPG